MPFLGQKRPTGRECQAGLCDAAPLAVFGLRTARAPLSAVSILDCISHPMVAKPLQKRISPMSSKKPTLQTASRDEIGTGGRKVLCALCKKPFLSFRPNQKFCSPSHQQQHYRIKHGLISPSCLQCEANLSSRKRFKKSFCSIECYDSFRHHLILRLGGDASPTIVRLCQGLSIETLQAVLEGRKV